MPHIVLTVDNEVVYDNQAITGGSKNESKNESKELQEGGKKKGKGTRKTNGSKKPLTGYMKFCQAERAKLLAEKPELKSDIPGIGRALGAKWRALSDAEKAKY